MMIVKKKNFFVFLYSINFSFSESDDEFDVPSTTSKSTRNGKTSESTQPSSTHLGRRHRKQSKTSNT